MEAAEAVENRFLLRGFEGFEVPPDPAEFVESQVEALRIGIPVVPFGRPFVGVVAPGVSIDFLEYSDSTDDCLDSDPVDGSPSVEGTLFEPAVEDDFESDFFLPNKKGLRILLTPPSLSFSFDELNP